jgi:glycosyltransferase involved in cell wall biosynthesis
MTNAPKPIRVVTLTPYFRPIVGGVESNAERLSRYLQADGFQVRVLTKRVTRDLPNREEDSGFTIERIGLYGERSGAGKWLFTPFVMLWLLRHRRSYDVVCCIDYRAVGVAALAARTITHRPVVLQAQTSGVLSGDNADRVLRRFTIDAQGRFAKAVKRRIGAAYKRADAFACISHEIEREALACGVPRDRVHFLPNAIDMTLFRPATEDERRQRRAALNVSPSAVLCLFVGRLSREKGLMDLMEAWRLIRGDVVLLIAGPDMPGHAWNVGPAARDFAERHGLVGSTRFLGSITDVGSLVRMADVVVQPSHFEALGLSAIEALASGVPVVATAVGGLLDFIVDGVNGRLCQPHDPVALAACIQATVSDFAGRARLAAAARGSVLEEYDERRVFSRFASLLRGLVAARG